LFNHIGACPLITRLDHTPVRFQCRLTTAKVFAQGILDIFHRNSQDLTHNADISHVLHVFAQISRDLCLAHHLADGHGVIDKVGIGIRWLLQVVSVEDYAAFWQVRQVVRESVSVHRDDDVIIRHSAKIPFF